MTDVNVWLALATDRHQEHASAREWFLSLGEGGAVFCRVTQMGLLRLLTQPAVMGEDVLKPLDAWQRYRSLRLDWRVSFVAEPAGIEQTWIDLMRAAPGASWTDAYLAAFALGYGYNLVSFDRGFGRWSRLGSTLLLPERQISRVNCMRGQTAGPTAR